jgi:hypothetical protein
MKYGILFATVSVVLLLQAVVLGGFWWLLAWPGTSFAIVASAYLRMGPRVFGKRSDGTMAWYAVIPLLPYLLLTWLMWHVVRMTTREDCCNEAAPGLFVGRRPLAGDVPPAVAMIVDLTAEFPECRAVRTGRQYVSFPMLDAGTAREDDFAAVVDRVASSNGPIYIHCAQGHGRTGTLAAAVMVVSGQAATADEAIRRLREVRPHLDLSRKQAAFVRRILGKRRGRERPVAD